MNQVRYFIALCKVRNFTRAARQCRVTQPSLSCAIKRLEQELGGTLFYRAPGGVTLSPLGYAVEPHIHQIDRAAKAARRAAKKLHEVWPASDPNGSIREAARPFVARRNGRYRAMPQKYVTEKKAETRREG